MRLGGPRGKFWFDLDLLDATIERRMMESVGPAAQETAGSIRVISEGRR
jgi:hypothetical protein